MLVPSLRITVVPICLASTFLISCSTSPSTKVGTPDFYWTAAAKTYAAGDYLKTLDDLDQVAAVANPHTSEAAVWRLVLTSGIARGYMDLADRYAAGARFNKAGALELRLKATQYRTIAGGLALRLAEQTDSLRQVPLGAIPLAFPFPRGNPAEPALLARIAAGKQISTAEQESAETLAVDRGVLMAVCLVAGAPNDIAKARAILNGDAPRATRAAFGDAVARTLDAEGALFARNQLDDPGKGAILAKCAERVRAEASRVGSARIGLVVSAESH